MGMKRTYILVEGMSCASCERRIERSLSGVEGIRSAKADYRRGRVELEYESDKISLEAVKSLIAHTGYPVKNGGNAATFVALGIGVALSAAYMAASSAGLFNALPKIDATIGYGMLFVVGLLTSVHCVAMCGGIALSQSVSSIGGDATAVAGKKRAKIEPGKALPGLLYNSGRVVSYTIVGGLVGALGSVFDFSPTVKALIAGVAGLFMVFMGLQMMGLLSWLPAFGKLIPASLFKQSDKASVAAAKRGPFVVGLLNGLMPCGPLQTMQIYALGTGSALAGALSMFLFSLGTVPLLLGFGIVAAVMPRKVVPIMLKASAVLVMFLGVLTFGRAAAFAGISIPAASVSRQPERPSVSGSASQELPVVQVDSRASTAPKAVIENGVQTVRTTFGANDYVPFSVQAGVPLKWIITITKENLNGCNNAIIVPEYGIKKKLVPGENIVEFTPKKEGIIAYSCWMGMIRSQITVVSKLSAAAAPPATAVDQKSASTGEQGLPACSSCGE